MAEDDSREFSGTAASTPEDEWREYERQFERGFTNYGTFEEFWQAILDFRACLTPEQLALVRGWMAIGEKNPWISRAVDPPFNELSFHTCQGFRELAEKLLHGSWCLGQAFALENFCFINQVGGGDEWLAIRGDVSFESITMQAFQETREEAEARLAETIERIRRATDEQLRRLEY